MFEIGVCIVIYVDFCARSGGGPGGRRCAGLPAAAACCFNGYSGRGSLTIYGVHTPMCMDALSMLAVYGRLDNSSPRKRREMSRLIFGWPLKVVFGGFLRFGILPIN